MMTAERRAEIERHIAALPALYMNVTCEPGWCDQAIVELLAEVDRLNAELSFHTCKPPLGNPTREETIAEITRLRAELHAGHTLIPIMRPMPERRGWMQCVRLDCDYETPSLGWCAAHGVLDACWATQAEERDE